MRLYKAETPQDVEVICDWVNSHLPEHESFQYPYAVAVVEPNGDGTMHILAGCVYTNYSGSNIFISGAIAKEGIGKVTRGHLQEFLRVAFAEPLDCLRVTALVSETNKRSQRFVEGLGFKLEGSLRDYLEEGRVTHLYGLTRSDWLGGKYGRERRRRAAS